jgi:DNA-binding NarL/FixJ family response regulator
LAALALLHMIRASGWRRPTELGVRVRIFIVFRDTIYASGLVATLADSQEIEVVDHASSIALAWEHEALAEADVVLLDSELGGADAFVQELAVGTGARILLLLRDTTGTEVLEAVGNGAAGVLARDQMTPDSIVAAARACAAGLFAFDVGVVRSLSSAVAPREIQPPAPSRVGSFTAREQTVLTLVASGLSNREIAERLSYSERTIKTVLHDIITKLGVKSRSQAVALAVRERMI